MIPEHPWNNNDGTIDQRIGNIDTLPGKRFKKQFLRQFSTSPGLLLYTPGKKEKF